MAITRPFEILVLNLPLRLPSCGAIKDHSFGQFLRLPAFGINFVLTFCCSCCCCSWFLFVPCCCCCCPFFFALAWLHFNRHFCADKRRAKIVSVCESCPLDALVVSSTRVAAQRSSCCRCTPPNELHSWRLSEASQRTYRN